ncbi:PD40 domain-containing protein [Sinomicrobium weinanense]|uniref:PD40 domain-containing protein n=1 Tax=Sinomicrobium weinanense TaxID=2842200 RepID=A0A926JPX3_9FLAO|nr:PD40 domain-containing protein [Sinomicrobium weinanense]MBC9795283.1 PD40 domain-containing protein [Sinomicrobium weinanense]MBU3125755.1 hypothetical protein [Sinomicrobium weinanense]
MSTKKKTLKTCKKGHQYYRSSVLLSVLFLLIQSVSGQKAPSGNRPAVHDKGTDTLPPYALAAAHGQKAPVLFAPGVISTGDDDAHATFTKDGSTVYFLKSTPQFDHWTVVVSHFKNEHWTTPEVAPFSGRYSDADVAFSPDGNTLFFISDRPVKKGDKVKADTDIWKMEKTAEGWGNPQHIAALSSPGSEWFPTVTKNGTVYFGSERREGNLGPEGTSDLWRSRSMNGRYTEPENLGPVINTAGQDIEAYIDPDERFMIFSSNGRKDTRGAYDLYISYNSNDKWGEPLHLGDTVNSGGWEFGAKLSPDGRYLFFTSNRRLYDKQSKQRLSYEELMEMLHSPGNGMRDIYMIAVDQLPLFSKTH